MTSLMVAERGLDYRTCRYGRSRVEFRGPRRDLDDDYIAVLGGSETFGKYVEQPYPALLESALRRTVVNLGVVNAGLDVFTADHAVLGICDAAEALVFQITGAHNLSNRYYSVHPRRNDRFLKPSSALVDLYPEIDFTEFHFTRHLLQGLHAQDPRRFARIEAELKTAWTARLNSFLAMIEAPVLLLWVARRDPEAPCDLHDANDPLFVTSDMIARVMPSAADFIRVRPSQSALRRATEGMVYSEGEALAVMELPNPAHHSEIAGALAPRLLALL